MTEELARDSQGRYAYNPEYFGKTRTPYSQDDHDYLVKWYDKIPLDEMAFALERTPTSIEGTVTQGTGTQGTGTQGTVTQLISLTVFSVLKKTQ